MDPVRIKRWLEACGKPHGIRSAYYVRCADVQTRQVEAHCTYRFLDATPLQDGTQDLTTVVGTTVMHSGCTYHRVRVRVDLYNSENGLYELASFGVATKCPLIMGIFDGLCGVIETERVVCQTTADDERVYHHQYAEYAFNMPVAYELVEINGLVEQIEINIETDSPVYTVDDTGYEVT